MSKYKKLREKFPDNKLVKFIATKGECKLSLKERWVYSTLLWRYKGKPVSKARLAKWTGVDRTRTLPRVLIRLSNLRLVVKAGQKFKAVQPPDDMMPLFATWVKGEGKHERLVLSNNWAVYSPDRDIIDNLVACDDALGHHAAAKLARRYGVSAKTITAARRRLKAQSLVADLVPTAIAQAEAIPLRERDVAIPGKPLVLGERSSLEPAKQADPAHQLAAQYSKVFGIGPDATKQIARLCRLLKGLSSKEIGQIVSAFVAKYGKGEGLDDAVYHFIQTHQLRYFTGASLERVMGDIGVGYSVDADDDLSMVGDVEREFAVAV
jgi:hypothetical protein